MRSARSLKKFHTNFSDRCAPREKTALRLRRRRRRRSPLVIDEKRACFRHSSQLSVGYLRRFATINRPPAYIVITFRIFSPHIATCRHNRNNIATYREPAADHCELRSFRAYTLLLRAPKVTTRRSRAYCNADPGSPVHA